MKLNRWLCFKNGIIYTIFFSCIFCSNYSYWANHKMQPNTKLSVLLKNKRPKFKVSFGIFIFLFLQRHIIRLKNDQKIIWII